jgi:hypothetical protein
MSSHIIQKDGAVVMSLSAEVKDFQQYVIQVLRVDTFLSFEQFELRAEEHTSFHFY